MFVPGSMRGRCPDPVGIAGAGTFTETKNEKVRYLNKIWSAPSKSMFPERASSDRKVPTHTCVYNFTYEPHGPARPARPADEKHISQRK